jgi:cullin-associated NEDD8-dissociated protein 1
LKENEIIQIFTKIITYICDPKAVIGRDIYVTCIKAILKEMNSSSCYTVGNTIIPSLLKGLTEDNLEIKELCFDTLNDYINTFNYVLIKESESVLKNKDALVNYALDAIKVDNLTLRKTASNFLGNFSLILNKSQLNNMVNTLISKIHKTEDIDEKIIYIVTLNSVAKNTANRNVEVIKTIIPMLLEFCNKDYLEANSHNYDQNNDLVENGLNLIETYILKVTQHMKEYVKEILETVLRLTEYDPNYVYNDSPMDVDEDYSNAYEDYDNDFAFSDDSSWKVRRGAVRVLQSFVKSSLEIPKGGLLETVIQVLVFNLREHDENTKLDIIACLSSMIRNLYVEDTDSRVSEFAQQSLIRTKSSSLIVITPIIMDLLSNILKELKQKNNKVKISILQLLTSLALVTPVDILGALNELLPLLDNCNADNISIYTVYVFFGNLLKSLKNTPEIVPYFDTLIKWFKKGINHDYYKINIESLKMGFYLVKVLAEYLSPEEYKFGLMEIYDSLLSKFEANDIDQELKIAIIGTVGNLILNMGHQLEQKKLDHLFNVYLEKIKNENLRPLVFNWLIKIMKNNPLLKLDSALSQWTKSILELLVKHSLHIQYQTLEFLSTVLNVCPNAVRGSENNIIDTLLSILSEESLVHLIYDIFNSVFQHFKIQTDVTEKTLKETITLLENTKVSGTSLAPIVAFIEIAAKKLDKSAIAKTLSGIVDLANTNQNKAICIAILAKHSDGQDGIIKTCEAKLADKNTDETVLKNALTLLGEVVLRSSSVPNDLLVRLHSGLTKNNEEIKLSLSVCIGKVGVSDPQAFINLILKNTDKTLIPYYFIAIREFLHVVSTGQSKNVDANHITELFNLLALHAKADDEKLRVLAGECLGLIALLNENVLHKFITFLNDSDTTTRATFYYGLKNVFSIKFNISGISEDLLHNLLKGLVDSDLHVKQNAFNSLINFAQNFSEQLRPRFADLMEILKKEHIINPDLVSTVDIGGGMKIKNDKGLPIRKAIYSTIKVLLENTPEKVNVSDTLQICIYGLSKYCD